MIRWWKSWEAKKVSLEEFHRILESGFSSMEAGIIPTTLDQVLVGSVQRSKSQHVKALFVLGLNDGILPAGSREEGLLAAEERDVLLNQGLNLGGNTELLAADEKFGIYTALSKPSDFLWVSYALSDTEGKALRPSYIGGPAGEAVSRAYLHQWPGYGRRTAAGNDIHPDSTFKFMSEHMRNCADGKEDSLLWWLVYSWYSSQPEWKGRTDQLKQALFHRNQEAPLGGRRPQAYTRFLSGPV